MSALSIQGTKTALVINNIPYFGASGGTPTYTFSVAPMVVGVSGAGGTINSSTGLYTAPSSVQPNSRNFYDTIIVTDSTGATAQAYIWVVYAWQLVGEILANDLAIAPERVYFWNQKIAMPTDNNLFLVLALARSKPLASNNAPTGTPVGSGGPGWSQAISWTQVNSSMDIHVYSRGTDALYRLPEVFESLQSPYSRSQQRANGFYVSKVARNANDLSSVDGDAIPYHYVVSCEIIWTHMKTITPPYWATFPEPVVELVQA